jgi:nucleoside phosphorylase
MRVSFCAAVAAELRELGGEALGVGPVVAGISAGAWLARARPEAVVLLGTCGSYPGGPPVGAVVASGTLGLGSAAAAMGLGYVPMAPGVLPGSELLLDRLPVPRARVLTVQAVSTAEGLVAAFARDWEVEHMESWAVARACADLSIPFVALLGVANRVGPDAHAEWRANRGAVEAAVVAVAAGLHAG